MLLENLDMENIGSIPVIKHECYHPKNNVIMGATNIRDKKGRSYYTTNDCLKVLLIISQFFGVFPIHKVFESNKNLIFRWSWKVVYTIFLALSFFIYSVLSFVKALQEEGIFLYQMITPLYNLCICLILLTFIQIARDWQQFSRLVSKVENEFSSKYESGFRLPRKIYFISSILLIAAFVEHALSIGFMVLSKNCDNKSTGWEYYLKKHFHYVYHYIDFSLPIGLICFIQSWMGAFIWNFCDVFIVVVSIIMTERFHQITVKVKNHLENQGLMFHSRVGSRRIGKLFINDSVKSEIQFWGEIHVDYDKMCNIIHLLDEILSNLLLVSYSTNLIFILIRLFVSLRQMSSNVEIIYFYSSFACVISRTILVSIFGGLMNDETKSLVPYLNTASTHEYNDHMLRLLQQINFSNNALTGHNFFKVTKGSVLNVAAAIITYELVLIQFNQRSLEKMAYVENSTICF
ncbi:gustatory receptor for sugar taste 64e-like [Harmonia axyridis]|uniref:gustatory receptor for sugar taste 64e-like n=1 Tax=Harmonia axyridis TaxID=115357 RepID=UPI001E278047|nr:gustatory receptor for sugar taste 64e-like [Harmonia axyridis]